MPIELKEATEPALAAPAAISGRSAAPAAGVESAPAGARSLTAARRGRPPILAREALLERIRRLADRAGGLFRMHRTHPELYARARRTFGSWAEAVRAAGVDYRAMRENARARGVANRRRQRRGRRSRAAGGEPTR